MTIHVERATSEVIVEPAEGGEHGPKHASLDRKAIERLHAWMERRERDALRTRARGYDD